MLSNIIVGGQEQRDKTETKCTIDKNSPVKSIINLFIIFFFFFGSVKVKIYV